MLEKLNEFKEKTECLYNQWIKILLKLFSLNYFDKCYFPREIRRVIQKTSWAARGPRVGVCLWLV